MARRIVTISPVAAVQITATIVCQEWVSSWLVPGSTCSLQHHNHSELHLTYPLR